MIRILGYLFGRKRRARQDLNCYSANWSIELLLWTQHQSVWYRGKNEVLGIYNLCPNIVKVFIGLLFIPLDYVIFFCSATATHVPFI